MEIPPYLVTSTHWISYDDTVDAIATFEESFDVEWAMPPAPHFQLFKEGLSLSSTQESRKYRLDAPQPEKLSSSITLLVDADDPEILAGLCVQPGFTKRQPIFSVPDCAHKRNQNPFRKAGREDQDASSTPNTTTSLRILSPLIPRQAITQECFLRRRISRSLTGRSKSAGHGTMVRPQREGRVQRRSLAELLPYVIFDKQALPFDRLYELISIYADFPHMLIEAPDGPSDVLL
jgi:hypothetical protein